MHRIAVGAEEKVVRVYDATQPFVDRASASGWLAGLQPFDGGGRRGVEAAGADASRVGRADSYLLSEARRRVSMARRSRAYLPTLGLSNKAIVVREGASATAVASSWGEEEQKVGDERRGGSGQISASGEESMPARLTSAGVQVASADTHVLSGETLQDRLKQE